MSRRSRNLVFGALSIAVVVVTFVFVLPRIADYGEVWEVVRSLDGTWLLALLAVVLLNVVTYAPPWMLALPGLRFRQALPFTQASTAFTYIAPGGGLVGMAGSYGLLRAWGFESAEVARAVAITGIWNQLSNLLLPVIAVTLLSIEGGETRCSRPLPSSGRWSSRSPSASSRSSSGPRASRILSAISPSAR